MKHRPAWRDVEAALDRYDPKVLSLTVHAWLDEFMPRSVVRKKGRPELPDLATYQRRIDLVLGRALGAWYGQGGWRVANESFGGCFCHGFLGEFATEPRRQGVFRATDWTLAEVDAMTRCLRDFGELFRSCEKPDDPGERAAAFLVALEEIFDTVIAATSCNGTWFGYVADGVLWLLEHHGVEVPSVLEDLVDECITGVCEESIEPPTEARHRLCEDLAYVAVSATL